MTEVPITLGPPVLAQVMAGACTALRRLPTPRWSAIAVGQLLWIREPFHLPAKFGGLSPTAAAGLGARPIFSEDVRLRRNADIGRQRISYTLPRAWHRQHLKVIDVRLGRLHSITDAEIAAEGYANRGSYQLAWERGQLVSGDLRTAREGPLSWEADPEVVVVRFEHVAAPIDFAALAREAT